MRLYVHLKKLETKIEKRKKKSKTIHMNSEKSICHLIIYGTIFFFFTICVIFRHYYHAKCMFLTSLIWLIFSDFFMWRSSEILIVQNFWLMVVYTEASLKYVIQERLKFVQSIRLTLPVANLKKIAKRSCLVLGHVIYKFNSIDCRIKRGESFALFFSIYTAIIILFSL